MFYPASTIGEHHGEGKWIEVLQAHGRLSICWDNSLVICSHMRSGWLCCGGQSANPCWLYNDHINAEDRSNTFGKDDKAMWWMSHPQGVLPLGSQHPCQGAQEHEEANYAPSWRHNLQQNVFLFLKCDAALRANFLAHHRTRNPKELEPLWRTKPPEVMYSSCLCQHRKSLAWPV